MEWNRSETFGLSRATCQLCEGTGARTYKGNDDPCPCVLRAIFRACYRRFVECQLASDAGSTAAAFGVTMERSNLWSRKNEEFVADFMLLSQRTLTEEESKIFRYRYILGADWKLSCRKLKMDKGLYFHALYRLQAKLGRVFRETEPYALFPLNEYFSVSSHMSLKSEKRVVAIDNRRSLSAMVPLAKAA